ncbi:MAG: hypothetical protein EON94_16580 [Caulobacteraceae bacterium]|nr:MAG: hypothetical protein EON94_16580 [Caulobacteraceae bacterium]
MRNILVVSLLAAAAGASAQPVWRCGNSYGSVPCEGGAIVGKPSPVSAGDAARARAVGQADATLAGALEKERLQREKQAPKAVIPPVAVASASAKASEQKPGDKKPGDKKTAGKKGAADKKKPELLTAVAPGTKK